MTALKRLLPFASALIMLLLAILLVPPNLHVAPSVRASSRTITLIGSISAWNFSQPSGSNPSITVMQGDSVTMQLSSGDGYQHRFLVDVDGDGFADCSDNDPCSPYFMTSTSISYPFTVNFAPGNYTYYCTIHYTSMVGKMIVQGFTTTSNPTSLTIVQGSSDVSTVTLASINQFAGTVGLSYSAPVGIAASFNPTSVSLTSGSSGTSQATISVANTVMAGSYTVTLTGASGSVMQSTTVTITVSVPGSPDFTISASPTSSTVNSGVQGGSTITIAPLNGFTGTVSLTATTNSTGLACSLSSTSIAGGSGTSTLSCSSSTAANYLATITGMSGTLSHSASVIYHVQDFSLSVNPASVNVTQGSTGSTAITLSGLNGFSGALSLTGKASPSGPSVSFSPASVTVSGGSATSTLTVSAVGGPYGSVANGNYSVNVTATSGSLSHSTTVVVIVGSSNSSPSGLANLPLTALVGVAIVIIAAAGVAVYLVRRRNAAK